VVSRKKRKRMQREGKIDDIIGRRIRKLIRSWRKERIIGDA
jgi:hypothetical protein